MVTGDILDGKHLAGPKRPGFQGVAVFFEGVVHGEARAGEEIGHDRLADVGIDEFFVVDVVGIADGAAIVENGGGAENGAEVFLVRELRIDFPEIGGYSPEEHPSDRGIGKKGTVKSEVVLQTNRGSFSPRDMILSI